MSRRKRARPSLVVTMLARVAGVAAMAVTFLAPTAAVATDGDLIEVSPDGVQFSRTFSGLLDGAVLVPHGSAEDSFFVRNTTDEAGYLYVGLTDVDVPDSVLLDSLAAELRAPANMTGTALLADAAPCVELLTAIPLPAHTTIPLTAGILLGDLDGLRGQGGSLSFRLQFVLTSEAGGIGASGCVARDGSSPAPPQTSKPGLPELGVTGGTVPILGLALAVGLFGVGAALMSRRRRKEDGA